MALETATYINGLVATNPEVGDNVSTIDDHARLIKSTILSTFPNITGQVTPTHTELNYVDGVTSAIQTQLDSKAALNSPALTGTPTAPTATAGTNTTQVATTAFVQTAVGGLSSAGAWTLLTTNSPTASAASDFTTGISSTYDEYMVVLTKVKPASDATLYLRTSTDGGSTFDASASDYNYSIDGGTAASAAQFPITGAVDAGSAYGASGIVYIFKPSDATYCHIISDMLFTDTSVAPDSQRTHGWRAAVANVDAIRFLFSTGNIASGTLRLYGRRK